MPDSMTADTMDKATTSRSLSRSPSQSPTIRDRPTHPASDITALREAVSAAFAQTAASSHQQKHSSTTGTRTRNTSLSLDSRAAESPSSTAMDLNHSSSIMMPESDNSQQQSYRRSQQRVPAPSPEQPLQLELPHHHPEAPGTPWIGSPLQPTLGGDFEDDETQSHVDGDNDAGPSATSNIDIPLASNADASQPLHTSPSSHPLLADNAPASLITSDVIEDADGPIREESVASPSNANREPRRSSAAWPSASEMDEEEFKHYLASLEIAKPKPRPRRKHLDRKMELARLKQQLVNILAYRTELLQSTNASSAPPDIQEATDRILRVHGLPSAAEVQQASNHNLQGSELAGRQIERPSSAPSTSSARSNQASTTAASDSTNTEAIEEEIFAMNDEIQKLMISINELDKIKDPQIELSFTGPKQKNLQRARPDDDLWTEHTGRAPGIRRLSGFGTAYDTERTILTPAISECSEIPTLSPRSSRSSIASTRSARSMRSNRSDPGNRLANKVSIMQTLAEAEDPADQGAPAPTGYAGDTDEGISQAVAAGSVSIDRDAWQRDLEQWALRASPPPADHQEDHTTYEANDSVSPTSSAARTGRTDQSKRRSAERHVRTLSIATTASSTVSYPLNNSSAPSPRLQNESEAGNGNPHGLSMRIPHETQRGIPRKPPSSSRTRKEHIVAGLQGDEWSGHRSLSAEKRAAAALQQQKNTPASNELQRNPPPPLSPSSSRGRSEAANSPDRSRSPMTAGTTLRLAAETLVSTVASAAHAVGIGSDIEAPAKNVHHSPPPQNPRSPIRSPRLADASQNRVASMQVMNSLEAPISLSREHAGPSVHPQSTVSHREQQQMATLKPPSAKRSRRPRLTEEEKEEARVKEAARQAKEQQKIARWHHRHLAIDAKKAFQQRKDDLHNRLSNTRNEDARAEIQWELGELYASHAWGEMSETPGGRDKPALGAPAITHALRVMYEALCSPARKEKGTVPPIATDANKWARYAQLHMVVWCQGGGKTHFEWGIRAFNEAIKHSGNTTEQAGQICTAAAQAVQAQAGASPELLQRAIQYWQQSIKCHSSDNAKMAWRYVNVAHCYDLLTMMSISQLAQDCDMLETRQRSIDAIERAHSLDPTNPNIGERLRYYRDCQEQERESLGGSAETSDCEGTSSHFSASSGGSVHQRRLGVGGANSEATISVERIEHISDHEDRDDEEQANEQNRDVVLELRHRSSLHESQESIGPLETSESAFNEREDDSDSTLTETPSHRPHAIDSSARNPNGQHAHSNPPLLSTPSNLTTSPVQAELSLQLQPSSPRLPLATYEDEHAMGDELSHDGDDQSSRTLQAFMSQAGSQERASSPEEGRSQELRDEPGSSQHRGWTHHHQPGRVNRESMRSAPPHPHVTSEHSRSDVEPRASSAHAVLPPQEPRYHAIDPNAVAQAFQQYHAALESFHRRVSEVETHLGRREAEDAAALQTRQEQERRHGQEFQWCQQQIQLTQVAQARQTEEMQVLRETVERMAAQLVSMQNGSAFAGPNPRTSREDGQSTRSPTPRSPVTALRRSTTSSQPRSRPTSMLIDGEQRPRSVPPIPTGRSSATMRSDDPPPSFHSSDHVYGRPMLAASSSTAQPGHPFYGPGENFENFDKQAMLERGAMLFGMYSLHQLARQTGLQTPLFPQRDPNVAP